jgi:hypothetical protein
MAGTHTSADGLDDAEPIGVVPRALDIRVTHIGTTEPHGPFHSKEIGP